MQQDQTPDATASADAADMDAAILQAELDQLRVAHDSLREEMLRERAELENQRRRLIRDVEQARRFANERLLSDLLPVFDSLDAGLNAAANQSGPLKDGLELTQKQLLKMAGEHGIVVVDPVGQTFDPEKHQAISQQPGSGAASGTVIQVFQKGYVLNDRLLRPALVVVAE